MIIRPIFLIDLIGRRILCVDRIHSHTPLETAGSFLTQQPLHLHLLLQILCALMNMGEPVDLVPRQMRFCSHQILILRS